MHEAGPPRESIDSIEKRESTQGTRDLAMENQSWVVWKFDNDPMNVDGGEFPIGERMGVVHGFRAAGETARLLMVRDVTIQFMKLVPTQPNERLSVGDVFVRRRKMVGSGRPKLDPNEGRAFPSAKEIEEQQEEEIRED